MSANPPALVKLVNEFLDFEPMARNSGIYASKTGYHNTYNHHASGTYGGQRDDYSIQQAADRVAINRNYASAVDISFDDARLHGIYTTINIYTDRIIAAMQRRDERLFYKGEMVLREIQGQADKDRAVEGWSLFQGHALTTTDLSHLWHIHFSFFRKFCNNYEALKGTFDVLMGRGAEVAFPGAAYFSDGRTSATIGRMNMRLRARGCPAPLSRTFDAASKNAYKKWQEDLGYSGSDADGIPGRSSWDALNVLVDGPLPPEPKPPAPAPKPQQKVEEVQTNTQIAIPAWAKEHWPDDKGLADGEITVQTALGSGYGHSRLAQERTAEIQQEVAALRADVAALKASIEALVANRPPA